MAEDGKGVKDAFGDLRKFCLAANPPLYAAPVALPPHSPYFYRSEIILSTLGFYCTSKFSLVYVKTLDFQMSLWPFEKPKHFCWLLQHY